MRVLIKGSPEEYAESLYWLYSEFESLTTDEVKKICLKTLDILMQDADTVKRVYYKTCKEIIKQRGVIE